MKKWIICCLLSVVLSVCAKTSVTYHFDSKAKESQFQTLLKDLRCLVCQNQNLFDSNASLAVDLKNKIYHSVQSGQSDAEIKRYLVKRYGDFILFKPPLKQSTMILWFLPFAMLVAGLLMLVPFIRRRREHV